MFIKYAGSEAMLLPESRGPFSDEKQPQNLKHTVNHDP